MPDYTISKIEDLPMSTKGESGRKRIVIVTNLGAHSLEYRVKSTRASIRHAAATLGSSAPASPSS